MAYDPTLLKQGIKIESEHKSTILFIKNFYNKHKRFPTDKMIYEHIAENHISEFPDYYPNLIKMEKRLAHKRKVQLKKAKGEFGGVF